jgi:alpha-1,2-glucosyltransferase
MKTTYKTDALFWSLIAGCFAVPALLLLVFPLRMADEGYHLYQINLFLSGEFGVDAAITMIPTYHLVIARIATLLGLESDVQIRLISFSVALTLCFAFMSLVRSARDEDSISNYLGTSQFILFPILFPFFFFVYTDTWALLFVILGFDRLYRQQLLLSALFFIIAMLIRQTNIIWMGMAWLLYILDNRRTTIDVSTFILVLKETWLFAVGLIGFILFVYWNGSIAMGDKDLHTVSLSLSNVYFSLLLFFLLFLPLNLANINKIRSLLKENPRIWILIAISLPVFWNTYFIDHYYNGPQLWFYLHNRLLFWTTSNEVLKLLTFVAISWSVLSLVVTKLLKRSQYLLYIFAAASILPFPLVEQRYYLVSMALFMAFRERQSILVESSLIVIYLVTCSWLVWGIYQAYFFL